MKNGPRESHKKNVINIMTEQEILRLQEANGQRSFYLVLVGKFFHACGCGAFALSRATGYRVMRKQRKWGEVMVCGFPIDRFDLVRDRIRDAGGDIYSQDDKTWMFRGLNGTPDPQMVCEPAPKPEPKPQELTASTENLPAADGYGWLAEAVRGFNLSQSTPMDAMLFVNDLQHRLNNNADTTTGACESPAGHGLQE